MMRFFKSQRPETDSDISAKTIAVYQNKILLMQNPDNTYELPGGHIMKNEPLMVGAAREFYEETGLIVNLKKIIRRKPNRVIYLGKLLSKNVKISNEHIGFIFVPINNLYNYKLSKKAHKDLHFLKK
jgi:8-oxo-dGTP pyrophosphatase MutT (NUDIX family)